MTYKFQLLILIFTDVFMEFMGLINPWIMKCLIAYIKTTNHHSRKVKKVEDIEGATQFKASIFDYFGFDRESYEYGAIIVISYCAIEMFICYLNQLKDTSIDTEANKAKNLLRFVIHRKFSKISPATNKSF